MLEEGATIDEIDRVMLDFGCRWVPWRSWIRSASTSPATSPEFSRGVPRPRPRSTDCRSSRKGWLGRKTGRGSISPTACRRGGGRRGSGRAPATGARGTIRGAAARRERGVYGAISARPRARGRRTDRDAAGLPMINEARAASRRCRRPSLHVDLAMVSEPASRRSAAASCDTPTPWRHRVVQGLEALAGGMVPASWRPAFSWRWRAKATFFEKE